MLGLLNTNAFPRASLSQVLQQAAALPVLQAEPVGTHYQLVNFAKSYVAVV